MPKWTRATREMVDEFGDGRINDKLGEIKLQDNQLDYGKTKHCLVGEGRFFQNSNYFDYDLQQMCGTCEGLCGAPARLAIGSMERLYKFKKKLYTHFASKHPTIHKKWEKKKRGE